MVAAKVDVETNPAEVGVGYGVPLSYGLDRGDWSDRVQGDELVLVIT